MFLIWRPLTFFSPSVCSSSCDRPPFGMLPLTRLRKATQIWRFASEDRSWYRSETWMRDWNASSKTRTRFVVRKRMPRKYLVRGSGTGYR